MASSPPPLPTTMLAAVLRAPGGPSALTLEKRPIPVPQAGQILIRIHAFGLNRSELFTRQGLSPDVSLPRILGIEGVGTVESAPGNEFQRGDIVATAMGGLGRAFDGSYAQYTCVPAAQAQLLYRKDEKRTLEWDVLGAMPEMLQTAWGALFKALRLQRGERLLVRGGTTSVGLAAAAIAKGHGAYVAATTRRADRKDLLLSNGADEVLVDDGNVAAQVRAEGEGEGFDKVLELIGTTTLKDSLRCAKPGGVVCMMGMVGNKWSFDDFSPMEVIPSTVCLTIYDGGSPEFRETPLRELAGQIEKGMLKLQIGKTFRLEEIVEAHRTMEENKAGGKIMVLV